MGWLTETSSKILEDGQHTSLESPRLLIIVMVTRSRASGGLVTIIYTCRRIPLSSHNRALAAALWDTISKTRSAVRGEAIAGQPSDIRGEQKGRCFTRADTFNMGAL